MPFSNFPKGFANGVSIRGLPVQQVYATSQASLTTTGKSGVYWVDSNNGLDGNDGTYGKPLATLERALNVASAYDIIMLKPGHAETISSATALNFDLASVSIEGLGVGNSRPTFTLDTATTATIPVSASNITIRNVVFTANFADIVSVFTLAAAKFFTVIDCEIKATATNMNFIHVFDTNTTTAAADGLTMVNCRWIEPDAATLAVCLVDGTNDRWTFVNNYFNLGGTTTAAMLFTIATGKVLTNVFVQDNLGIKIGQTDGSAGVWASTDGSTNTGFWSGNHSQNGDDAANIATTASSGWSFAENYHTGVVNESGVLLPTVFNNA